MDDDQQFCLRWNNHQSTLVAVFDTLLENGTLVDCTLAAEGKCLNAHKVVLSACSPYFEALLSKHFDKHPILILKDVKFQELKAMMDYMYRGEVNISQDQLGALLKAAESLQIKGLSDNKRGSDVKPAVPVQPKSPQPASSIPKVQGLTIEHRSREDSREGSQSPGPRKKKRLRPKSEELDNHDVHSNSSESHSNHGTTAQNIPISLPAPSKLAADVPEPLETKSDILLRHKPSDEIPQVPIKEKLETHTELMLEPKSEYVEEMNEDSIEDLTLDDDDISNLEQMDDGAGPSHGNMGEGSSQGFGAWHLGNQSQDEVFLAAQEAVGAHRDSQGFRNWNLRTREQINWPSEESTEFENSALCSPWDSSSLEDLNQESTNEDEIEQCCEDLQNDPLATIKTENAENSSVLASEFSLCPQYSGSGSAPSFSGISTYFDGDSSDLRLKNTDNSSSVMLENNDIKDEMSNSSSFTENNPELAADSQEKDDFSECKKGEVRKRERKKEFCLFCKSLVSNFARHIRRNHSQETETQEILLYPPNSLKRKRLLKQLRKKGNYLNHNFSCKPNKRRTQRSIISCSKCQGFYAAKSFENHRNECTGNKDKDSQHTVSEAKLKIDQNLRNLVFPKMRPDDISLLATNDSLICAYGARYITVHHGKHDIHITSRKMRELARLLIEVQKREPAIKSLLDALKPTHFDLLVEATKYVAKYDTQRGTYESPTYALNVGTALKQCAELAVILAPKSKEGDEKNAKDDLKTFIQVIRSKWRCEILTH